MTTLQPVARYGHTTVLVAVLGLLAFAGWLFQHIGHSAPAAAAHPRASAIPLYISLIAAEWGLLSFVRGGCRATGTTLADLVGDNRGGVRGLLRDCVLGVLLWGVWELAGWGWTSLFGADPAASVQGLLPRGAIESVLWVAVSASAGICEEVAFRGYCQRQFAALLHSRWLGLLLQALVFGIAHGYEGIRACIRIALYALLFSLLALWCKSLRPGMVGHALTDIVAGLFGF